MKLLFNIILLFILLNIQESYSQTIDTIVDMVNHKLHFKIVKGKGLPILFESGAGNDGTVWDSIIKPIAEITGATLITYDRAGIGTSTIDTLETDASKHGIMDDLKDLENALEKLGFNKEIMLISHSYGGYLSTLYSDRHPDLVKSIVLIDVNLNFWEKFEEKDKLEQQAKEMKDRELGLYYETINFPQTVKLMSKKNIPQHIPVVDFVNGVSFFDKPEMTEYWIECHKTFVAARPKSKGITANGCGHFIWHDNPVLVITTIAKTYAETSEETKKNNIYERALNYAIVSSNEAKKNNCTEENLNNWGYELLGNGELAKAIEIFKLNITLNPLSWNAFDSYGEALLKVNRKEEAIKMYKKSVELNPENKNGKDVLDELLKQ